ncbi:MAG: hypothetical protein NWF09_08950 [Candidatus Bathyarchaeota archaeon]|nr:hypothetical protein [Candidatus Bathyarchaeota archaeon]
MSWVEIRPLVTCEAEPYNFLPILQTLYNSGQPFRFIIADASDHDVQGRNVVRFYVQFPNDELLKYFASVLNAIYDVDIIRSEPPQTRYSYQADLSLASRVSMWLCNIGDKAKTANSIDQLVAAIAGTGSIIEVTAKGDPKSAIALGKIIYEREVGKASVSKIASDTIVGIIGEAAVQRDIKDQSRETWWKYGRQNKLSAWSQEEIARAKEKLSRLLFLCDIKIYSNNKDELHRIRNAFPSSTNKLRIYRVKKTKQATPLPANINPPRRHWLLNNILSKLWIAGFAAPLTIAYLTGAISIQQIIEANITPLLSTLIISTAAAVALLLIFRKRNPIILSDIELSSIIGLPTAIGKLPVAIGRTPSSRTQLGSEIENEEQPYAEQP